MGKAVAKGKRKAQGVATAKPRKKKASSAGSPVATPAPQSPPGAPLPQGYEDAYNQYLAAAKALDAKIVLPFHTNADVVYLNVQKGVAAVLARKADIAAQLPQVDMSAIAETVAIARALVFAVMLAKPRSAKNASLQANITEARKLRKLLIASADVAAEAGLLDPKEVALAKKGRGSTDVSHDLMHMASLFNKNAAALAGKTPITNAQIGRAAVLAAILGQQVSTTGARKKTNSGVDPQAAGVRDRIWTLLFEAYDLVERVAAFLLGPAHYSAEVPSLQSRVVSGSAAKKAKAAATAAAKATSKAKKAADRAAKVKGRQTPTTTTSVAIPVRQAP